MQERKTTERLIVHCSFTPPDMDIGVDEIRKWHVEGSGWSDIGYQDVIRRDGTLEAGRGENLVGAHTKGFNRTSIAVCLIGGKNKETGKDEFNFTDQQLTTLRQYINEKTIKYGANLQIAGHNEFTNTKSCPTFNVAAWYVFGDVVLAY